MFLHYSQQKHIPLLDNAYLDYYSEFLPQHKADSLFTQLSRNSPHSTISWRQDIITVNDRNVVEPRYTALLGRENNLCYRYSGKTMYSQQWPSLIQEIQDELSTALGFSFNVVLCNWYDSGLQHVSWHSDNEEDLVPNSSIVSLSLGSTRKFQIRHNSEAKIGSQQTEIFIKRKKGETLSEDEKQLLEYQVGQDPDKNKAILLNHGDLLIMGGDMQKAWRHRVPQVKKETISPRICLTFRCVENTDLIQSSG
eukprot:gb/GECH01006725.1/.p1 GENE.gb/GECH01006725.1/~~gb/GECH01006725.1/.p1  ORF type:complete len:252 (+),score=32.79 gb/GECH01006725.1/:1-756(+)